MGDDHEGELARLGRLHEAEVERERRFASSLIEAMPGVFYFYDERGRFLRWNRNFEQITGYSAEEIARMSPADFFRGDERELVQQRIAEVFARGEATVEASLTSKDGVSTPFFLTGRRLMLDGAPHLLGMGVDVSQRRVAEEALHRTEERHRTTLETSIEGCQLLGFDWRYLYLNPAAALQNRRPNAELLGRTMQEAWPGIEETGVYRMIARCMTERTAGRTETEFHFPDGTSGWFEVRVHAVPEGVFILSIDISTRKHAERALRELNENLERMVAARTADLEVALERAESADRLKSSFLATMSHELRTPLNSILGFTGIVLKGMAGPLNAEQTKQLGMVQRSARHLLDLINDVLDISKIEAGQLEVRCAPFDLRASIGHAVDTVTPLAAKKGLSLRCSLPPTLGSMDGDRRRVEQILLNLLNNAVKFTDRGEVHVEAEILAQEGAHAAEVARIQVRDTGIGMRADDMAKLFTPFHQIDAGLQRQHEGTGLGLAISRRLAELMGGTIGATSVHAEGSVFTLLLPMHRGAVAS